MSNEPSNPVPAAPVIVTGSSSGIGRAIAEHLLAQGMPVIGLDLAAPGLSAPGFEALQVDLSDAPAIAALAPRLHHARALVHAAGLLRVGRLGELDLQGGEIMWQVHVQAAAALANALAPAMAARGAGRMVFIGSRVASGMAGRGQYAATKAALLAMARSWAAELAPRGVTVNVISPAATQTAMLADPARAGSAPRVPPMGRYIQPGEIAALVAYLLSDAAAAITGQDIAICGGASLSG